MKTQRARAVLASIGQLDRVDARPRPIRPPPSSRFAAAAAGAGALALAVPVVLLWRDGTLERWWRAAANTIAALRDVDAGDLLGVLPPLADYAVPTDAGGRVTRAGVLLSPPAATLVLGWEGVCMDVLYDPKAGFVPVAREGFATLLLALADADAEVVVWSRSAPAAAVREQLFTLVRTLIVPRDMERHAAFQRFLTNNYERARAVEAGTAAKEGRAVRPMMPITDHDREELYAQNVLRIAAVLGREHCFAEDAGVGGGGGGGGTAAPPQPTTSPSPPAQVVIRPVALLTHGRAPWDVIVVDADTPSLAPEGSVNAAPFLTPAGMSASAANAAAAARTRPLHFPVPLFSARVAADAHEQGLPPPPPDTTLHLLSECFTRFAAWRSSARREHSSEAPVGGVFSAASASSSFAAYASLLSQRAREEGLLPTSGSHLDATRGVLRVVHRDVRRAQREATPVVAPL